MRYFIFEGADGIGKTTLARNFAQSINARFTFEPFDVCPLTGSLRKAALTHSIPRLAREYLLLANRSIGYDHLTGWLMEGDVVSDRSLISGMVYANMEGFRFEEWMEMARQLIDNRVPEDPIVILCVNDQYRNKANPEDRYDQRGTSFHAKVTREFRKAIPMFGYRHIEFKIDFDEPPEVNLHRLKEELNKIIK